MCDKVYLDAEKNRSNVLPPLIHFDLHLLTRGIYFGSLNILYVITNITIS